MHLNAKATLEETFTYTLFFLNDTYRELEYYNISM